MPYLFVATVGGAPKAAPGPPPRPSPFLLSAFRSPVPAHRSLICAYGASELVARATFDARVLVVPVALC